MEDEEDVQESIDIADSEGETEGEDHSLIGQEHQVIWQGTEDGSCHDGKTVDDDGQVSSYVDDGIYIRSDHSTTWRLREHKPSDDPAGEDAEKDPKTDDEQE